MSDPRTDRSNGDPARMAAAIRFLAADAILEAGEGHQGVPLGMAEIAAALYRSHIKFCPADPLWPDRDRFVLSNGHGSMLLYALLHLTGYEKITLDEIKRFRRLDSHCAGHPEFDPHAGIEVTTGPLGQGIANALGMAIAEEHLRARFGAELVDHRTWAFVGDGCLQEGVGQEAISLAGHLGLGRLTFIWDDNRITDDGATDLSISEDVAERFRVAGWHVVEIDGHDVEAVSRALDAARLDPRPSLLACRTVIARGIPRLEGRRGGHSAPIFAEDRAAMAERFGWDGGRFEIPADAADAWKAAGGRCRDAHAAWRERLAAADPALREEFLRSQGSLPAAGEAEALSAVKRAAAAAAEPAPLIKSSGNAAEALCSAAADVIVSCADLEAPTDHKRRLAAFTREDRAGRYIHCGVREHLMAALANGIAAHGGARAVAVTYLAFADYQRASMRMAALMKLPVIFVFSHDSIGIGRNGPTHQPVEIIASLRAMPDMTVIRPADAVEAAEAWEIAAAHRGGPLSLIFARQAVPRLRTDATGGNRTARGAYVLEEAGSGVRDVTLLATGSEVAIAVEARAILAARGIRAAVVSMPCWSLFERQDPAYRAAVLGPEGGVRVGIEAAVKFGWERWLGCDGPFIGMTGFGASGPAEDLYRRFGITAEAAADAAETALRNRGRG